jgi:hypothetical protein
MKERKPQPSPVGVVFRGHHERAGWFWADAMRATERNADAEKAGPEDRAGLAMALRAVTDAARRVFSYRETRAIRDSRLRSPATGSRTNLVLPAGSANFASAACGAPRKLDRSRAYYGRLARAKPRGLLRCLRR